MRRLKAEWEKQNAVIVSFPHEKTDWIDDGLESAFAPFVCIAQAIACTQLVYVVCDKKVNIVRYFCSTENIVFIEVPTNDTWVRDYGALSVDDGGNNILFDFVFDGWGGKFEAAFDNSVNGLLYEHGYMGNGPMVSVDYILEGGSIDSDGNNTVLTTTKCLCNTNRNVDSTKGSVEYMLNKHLGIDRVLWLDYGYLAGDDTDSHIDIIVRFVNHDTIVFVNCEDETDEHYIELQKMKKQLMGFRQKNGSMYKLIALPMPEPIVDKHDNRLAATYANFLITNKALLYPTYNDVSDKLVGDIFKNLFPNREVIPINCLKLIEQGGSLHCSTMQVSF